MNVWNLQRWTSCSPEVVGLVDRQTRRVDCDEFRWIASCPLQVSVTQFLTCQDKRRFSFDREIVFPQIYRKCRTFDRNLSKFDFPCVFQGNLKHRLSRFTMVITWWRKTFGDVIICIIKVYHLFCSAAFLWSMPCPFVFSSRIIGSNTYILTT